MKRKQTRSTNTLEKTLTLASVTLVAVGCIANIYGAYVNRRFIMDPLDLAYYLRFVILLGGGFAAGYAFTKRSHSEAMQNGGFYAIFAMALYSLFEIARFLLQNFASSLTYPWSKVLFEGGPLFAAIVALLIAYLSRNSAQTLMRKTFILAFIISQAYSLGQSIYYTSAVTWQTFLGYLFTPLVITIVSYFVLSNVKKSLDRVFYASVTAAIYWSLSTVLWEFRTDATAEATNIFNVAVTLITLAFTGFVLWRMRKNR